ncbi:MAG: TolC family protein [Candidatus Omnitrophota bacterium]
MTKQAVPKIYPGKVLIAAVPLIALCVCAPVSPRCETELSAGGGSVRSLTIKDAIQVAMLNNKSIQIQEEEVAFARSDIMYARSLFLPQVNAGFGYTLNDATLALSQPAASRKDPGIFSGYKNDNLFDLSLDESIYNGGANIATLRQAKLQLKAQQETLRAARLEVEFETKRLFYGLLLAYETRRIAQDLVDQAKAHYEEVLARFEQGTSSKFDVLQSKTQVSRLIPQLVNADNSIDLIMAELKKLLSINMSETVRVEGVLSYSPVEIKEDDFLHEAYQKNPGMVLKLLGIDINRWAIEFAKAGWLPQVSATADYSYRSGDVSDMVNPRHNNWNIGIKATIALFDGFATKAKVDEAKARYTQAFLQKEDIIEQIAVDIKTACLDLREAKAIIDAEKDSIDDAKEALRLSEVRYVNGVGINLDVFDSQVSLAQVEQSLAQGIYDHIMAKAELDRTMGREFKGE